MEDPAIVDFYTTVATVERYERGRSGRAYVRHLPEILLVGVNRRQVVDLPLYVFFDWIYNQRMRELTRWVLSGSILDVGCGTSYFYRNLFEEGWRGQVSGCDVSSSMLDEGSRQVHELGQRCESMASDDGLYRYTDRLGRLAIDVRPPLLELDQESATHLLNNRFVRGVEDLPPGIFDTITAFSGPLCFFPVDEQEAFFVSMTQRANRYLSLQLKNQSFHAMNISAETVGKLAGLIRHIFERKSLDSYGFLQSVDTLRGQNHRPALPAA